MLSVEAETPAVFQHDDEVIVLLISEYCEVLEDEAMPCFELSLSIVLVYMKANAIF